MYMAQKYYKTDNMSELCEGFKAEMMCWYIQKQNTISIKKDSFKDPFTQSASMCCAKFRQR